MHITFNRSVALFAGLYALFFGGLIATVGVYNGMDSTSFEIQSRQMQAFILCGMVLLFCGIGALIFAYMDAIDELRQRFWLPLTLIIFQLIAVFLLIEGSLRAIAEPHSTGERIGNTVLFPYDWETVVKRNLDLVARNRESASYFIGDSQLGWTIGKNRTSQDGLYASSAEGARSSTLGYVYQDVPIDKRITLFGNSFVFSEEVGYEQSLGFHLERYMGPDFQVLNFGVPGYGIDQAFLRSTIETLAWTPDVSILGFIQDDLNRAAGIYMFLRPSWENPFSKPRYLLNNSRIDLQNFPTASPEEIFSADSVVDLPLIKHDLQYFEHYWNRDWIHTSYLFRLLISRFPRWPEPSEQTSTASILQLAANIAEQFVVNAEANGAVPLIVYLPSAGDFSGQDRRLADKAIAQLLADGIRIIDLRRCIRQRSVGENFFSDRGIHYSDYGNEVAADCLVPEIDKVLGL